MPATVCCGWERVAVETEEDMVGQCLVAVWRERCWWKAQQTDSRNVSKSKAVVVRWLEGDGTTIIGCYRMGLTRLARSKLELKRTLNVCHTDLPSRPRFSPFFRPCSLGPWELAEPLRATFCRSAPPQSSCHMFVGETFFGGWHSWCLAACWEAGQAGHGVGRR